MRVSHEDSACVLEPKIDYLINKCVKIQALVSGAVQNLTDGSCVVKLTTKFDGFSDRHYLL